MAVINSHIEEAVYSPVYLMGGDEKYLVHQFKHKLLEAVTDVTDSMNYQVFKGENATVSAIADSALAMPFFAERRVLLIEDSGFFKKGNEELEELIQNIPETTVMIFVEDNIDKRTKLYKAVGAKGTIALFDTPDEKMLIGWLRSLFKADNIAVSDQILRYIIENVGADMLTLSNEVEKLKCYCIEKGRVEQADVQGLSVSQIESKIFDMMDALSKKDKRVAIELYSDLLALREPAMRILFLIARQYNILLKTKLALQYGRSNGEIASAVKIPPFTVKKYVELCKGYEYEQLKANVELCLKADAQIKTGELADKMAVELLIMQLLTQ